MQRQDGEVHVLWFGAKGHMAPGGRWEADGPEESCRRGPVRLPFGWDSAMSPCTAAARQVVGRRTNPWQGGWPHADWGLDGS